jgi:hypothetical protein
MRMLQQPDSALCKEALRMAGAVLSEDILYHSLRTYHLASAYGDFLNHTHSKEELFLASVFHDFGFFSPYNIRGKPFQIGSSQALKRYLKDEGSVPPDRINAMMEAVDFHFQLSPRWDKGPIAGLLQVGAYMDAVGLKSHSIGKDFRKKIIQAYPKEGFFLSINLCLMRSFTGMGSVIGLFRPAPYCGHDHYMDTKQA